MCGITGFVIFKGAPPELGMLEAMCDSIVHRGPDDCGTDIQGNVAMGMRRLSIIDVAGGKQPVFNEDGTVRCVYNGEIYNFQELRDELIRRGHRFSSRTDTDVIVHAWEEYGAKFVTRFNGMFAFALHDIRNHKLVLARDPIGIKPLYYYSDSKCFVWGSEIKAILASRTVNRELNVDALGEFLTWEYVPGSKTLFRNIHKLEPGHMLIMDLRTFRFDIQCYWDVPGAAEDLKMTPEDWESLVDETLRKAVKSQLVSDVPLGAFLSGGVDSSLVVAGMGPAKTFSIGFDDPSYNELGWARRVANHLGVDHIDDIIRPDIVPLFDQLMHYMDDPIGDFSIFPTFLVSRHARKHVTVALSGDGGDELFGGYETYVADQMARWYQRMPAFVRNGFIEPFIGRLKPRPEKKGLVNKALRFIEGTRHPERLAHARWRIFAGESVRQALFTHQAREILETSAAGHIFSLFDKAGRRQPLNRNLYVDLKSYLCDNCLVKVDRMSMAVSLECRVPFLDKNIVELAFRIPEHLKVRNGKTKILLKRVADRHVPKECVYRPKEGFSIPIKNWLNKELNPLMEELLDRSVMASDGLFQAETVGSLKDEHVSGRANHSHVLWSLMVFMAWKKKWLEG